MFGHLHASSKNTVLVEAWQIEQGSSAPGGRLVFTLLFDVVLVVANTTEGELPLTAPTGVHVACPARNRPLSGCPVGCLCCGSTDINLGHMRTRTGHGACQGLCHVPNEQMFIPQHFSSWGLSNALKKKKNKNCLH